MKRTYNCDHEHMEKNDNNGILVCRDCGGVFVDEKDIHKVLWLWNLRYNTPKPKRA